MKKDSLRGIVFGLCTLVAYIHLDYGVIILIILLVAFFKFKIKFSLSMMAFSICGLSFFTIIYFAEKHGYDAKVIMPHMLTIVLLLLVPFMKITRLFTVSFEKVLLFASYLDCIINVISFLSGVDVFGRILDIREDGLIRSNGLLGTSFLSLGLATVGLLIGYKRNSILAMAVSILGLAVNQSLRSFSIIFLFFYFIGTNKLVSNKNKVVFFFISGILCAILFNLGVAISDSQSNIIRLGTWVISLEWIIKSPYYGNVGFSYHDLNNEINPTVLIESGVTENLVLDYALHFGLIGGLIFLITVYLNYIRLTKWLQFECSVDRYHVFLGFLIFTNCFYGNLLTTTFFIFFVVVELSNEVSSLKSSNQ